MPRGNGGGLPVGRRRRPGRPTSGAPGTAGPALPAGTRRGIAPMQSSCDQTARQSTPPRPPANPGHPTRPLTSNRMGLTVIPGQCPPRRHGDVHRDSSGQPGLTRRTPNGHMAGHRLRRRGAGALRADCGALPSQVHVFSDPGTGYLDQDGRDLAGAAGAGNPFRTPGHDPSGQIRVPATAGRSRNQSVRDTPGTKSAAAAAGAGMGGRGLSHPQEQPLTSAGSRRAPGKTGACGQLGSRTADRMAVPFEPFH
jgi:hypothetical protein